jgi:hypothetical protein
MIEGCPEESNGPRWGGSKMRIAMIGLGKMGAKKGAK